jgi:hypothetical protein
LFQNLSSSCFVSENINIKVQRTNFTSCSVWCDAWYLILINVYRLKILENVKKGSWPKKEEVTGGWKKSHNEELRDFYSLNKYTIRLIRSSVKRWAVHV